MDVFGDNGFDVARTEERRGDPPPADLDLRDQS